MSFKEIVNSISSYFGLEDDSVLLKVFWIGVATSINVFSIIAMIVMNRFFNYSVGEVFCLVFADLLLLLGSIFGLFFILDDLD